MGANAIARIIAPIADRALRSGDTPPMASLMVQGTSSWAGKSLLTTVLCRHFARQGISVAPFKAQNMSNNARVVHGGEIGTAQYLQALAARARPDVRMNPILVKPETERSSQVILRGVADPMLSALDWRSRAPHMWSAIEDSYTSLAEQYELIVIEGAGSPAEINLRDTDLANMPVARLADAHVLIVADIDRGGALAHLYGTWKLLREDDRARVRAFVLNRFRGDIELLEPAPSELRELTGVPMLGVVPMLAHGLPDEDGAGPTRLHASGPRVAVVRYPTAANLDELKLLEEVAQVVWARRPGDIEGAQLVVLPGSKHVAHDLAWLRAAGLEDPLRAHVAGGGRLLGICGGMQMLGVRLQDNSGRDADFDGLGLLELHTELGPAKRLAARTEARFAELQAPWSELAGQTVDGYEIRHGHTTAVAGARATAEALPDGLGWISAGVLGVYLHGLLESPALLRAITGAAPTGSIEQAIDRLTDEVMPWLDEDFLNELAHGAGMRSAGG
jgi:adenosylcobyric acid synthase